VPVPHVSFSRFIVVRFFSDQGTLICSETSKKLYIVFIVLKDVLAVNATNSVRREAAKVRKKRKKCRILLWEFAELFVPLPRHFDDFTCLEKKCL